MLRIYLLYARQAWPWMGRTWANATCGPSGSHAWLRWSQVRFTWRHVASVHSCLNSPFFSFFSPSPHRPCSQMHSLFVQLPNCAILQPPHQLSSNRKNWLCSGNDQALISAWEHILWFPSLKVNLHSELSPQHLARDGLHVKIFDWLYFKGHQ